MSYVWFGAMVLFVIIEAATMGINFIWFALGSLGAMIASMLGGRFYSNHCAYTLFYAAIGKKILQQ